MKDLTKGNPIRLLIRFAIPLLIGNLFQLFYSLADTRIVGETLGEDSLAAISATSPVNNLLIGFLCGLTNGFSLIVARHFGAKEEKELKRSVAGTITLGLVMALLVTILSVTFLRPLMQLLNTPANVFEEAYDYIRVILLGSTAAMLYNVCSGILRAIGDTVTPLLFLVFSSLVNIGLDYLFILKFHTGAEGAAYATVISQILSVLLCLIYIKLRYPLLHLKKSDFSFDSILISKLMGTGLSMGMMLSLVSIGTVALQGAINEFGSDTIVAHAAARKTTEFFMLPFSILGTALATYSSQNLGAKKPGRIKYGLRSCILITWVWCLFVILISYTLLPKIIQLITATEVQEIIDTAVRYQCFDTLFYFVPAVITLTRNTMQSIGDRITPLVSSFIELVGKVLIALFLAPRIGYWGIIVAEPIVWILMVIPLIVKIRSNPALKGVPASVEG
ncbi:MAG: MATE family efflux transporter [Lachnospiraceae bacterium]|nr:MATE family efflux transporter [Lachnospiraceae bacterium]